MSIRLMDPEPISTIVVLPSVNGMFNISYDVNLTNILPGPRSAALRDTSVEDNVCREMFAIVDMVNKAAALRPDVNIVIGTYYGLHINMANLWQGTGTNGHQSLSEEIILRVYI